MRALIRKVRGALGIGLTWGVLWAAIAYVFGLIVGVVDPDSIDPGESPALVATFTAITGFVSGVAFSALLSLAERRRTLRDLSALRAAVWGVLGAAAFPLLTAMNNNLLILVCPLGAVFASASVAIARRAERVGVAAPERLDSERLLDVNV